MSPNYFYINIKDTRMSSQEMYTLLLNHAKVSVVPGLQEWFGPNAEGYIRVSFATSKEILNEAFDRIEHIINTL